MFINFNINSNYFEPPYKKQEVLLISMLSALSKEIVPVYNNYETIDQLLDFFDYVNGGYIKLDSNCIFECMTDYCKPAIPGQDQSFLKLTIQRPLDGLIGCDPIFVVMLVDFVDGIIPGNYQPRLYRSGFGNLLAHLYDTNSFDQFYNLILDAVTWRPSSFSISTVEQHSERAVSLM